MLCGFKAFQHSLIFTVCISYGTLWNTRQYRALHHIALFAFHLCTLLYPYRTDVTIHSGGMNWPEIAEVYLEPSNVSLYGRWSANGMMMWLTPKIVNQFHARVILKFLCTVTKPHNVRRRKLFTSVMSNRWTKGFCPLPCTPSDWVTFGQSVILVNISNTLVTILYNSCSSQKLSSVAGGLHIFVQIMFISPDHCCKFICCSGPLITTFQWFGGGRSFGIPFLLGHTIEQ